jgi:NAD(P)-dependent dehydrogenase (short-subunit alcohol dehydrogenase family)
MDRPTLIVTGASQGIGRAIAYAAAARGVRVVMTASNRPALEMEAYHIEEQGGTVLVVDGDITRYEDCQKVVAQTVRAFGRIDAVINNAGIIGPLGLVSDVRPEDWARTLEVNVLGPLMICREAVPYLRETSGKIVNISSAAAELIVGGGSAYSTSKAALNHFSKVLAIEEPDITVVLFNPGNVDTPMQAEIREKGKVPSFEANHQYFMDLYEQGQLLPPEKPAVEAVTLAFYAPHEWTGEIIHWDEDRLLELKSKS